MSQELADTMLDDQPQKEKINLLGLSASRLSEFFEEIGEKKFRATQIIKWIHQEGECDFQKMTNLSKDLHLFPLGQYGTASSNFWCTVLLRPKGKNSQLTKWTMHSLLSCSAICCKTRLWTVWFSLQWRVILKGE